MAQWHLFQVQKVFLFCLLKRVIFLYYTYHSRKVKSDSINCSNDMAHLITFCFRRNNLPPSIPEAYWNDWTGHSLKWRYYIVYIYFLRTIYRNQPPIWRPNVWRLTLLFVTNKSWSWMELPMKWIKVRDFGFSFRLIFGEMEENILDDMWA